ncbi:uncharacterized protein Dvar_11560 [Desulfosarcina variabilis str. Montpellier]|uniref:hypothetical protein n=1 Tax=Desulfosarcina variabilis TaxID=2300 RepID=UPI003AFA27C3
MRLHKTITVVAVLITILVSAACTTNYGRLSVASEVARDFQTGVIQPDFQYYYSGRENIPYAIIGIDRKYSVPSRYWIPIQPDADQLRKMSGNIFQKVRVDPYGAVIMGPDGKKIGVWYSNVYNYTVRVDQQAQTVQILFANPENDDQPMW